VRCCLAYRSDKLLAKNQKKAISFQPHQIATLFGQVRSDRHVFAVPGAVGRRLELVDRRIADRPPDWTRSGRWKFITQSAIDMVWVCPEPLAPMTMIGSGFSGGLY
jgi:hypothetical protein